MNGYWAGVDLGGTNIVCGILNDAGRLIASGTMPTEASGGFDHVMDRIERLVEDVRIKSGIGNDQLNAAGIGTPGLIDPLAGVCELSTNLAWRNRPVARELGSRIGVPVFADNDVRMYTYGEAVAGAGRGCDHVLGITIGTGTAAAFWSEGRFLYGSGYYAGEIGHLPIPGIRRKCKCGLTGCLETCVSAPGMAKQAKALIKRGHASLLSEEAAESGIISGQAISAAYDRGDRVAGTVFRQTARWLAIALSGLILGLSPDIVVIGGGVAKAGGRLMIPLEEELRRRVHPDYMKRIKLDTARWNEEAGIIGSALCAKRRLQSS